MKRLFVTVSLISTITVILTSCTEKSFSQKDNNEKELNNYFVCSQMIDSDYGTHSSYSDSKIAVLDSVSPLNRYSVFRSYGKQDIKYDNVISEKGRMVCDVHYKNGYLYFYYVCRTQNVKRYISKVNASTFETEAVYNVPVGKTVFDICIDDSGKVYAVYMSRSLDNAESEDSTYNGVISLNADMTLCKDQNISVVCGNESNEFVSHCYIFDNTLFISTYTSVKTGEEEYSHEPCALYKLTSDISSSEKVNISFAELGTNFYEGFQTEDGRIYLTGSDDNGSAYVNIYKDSSFQEALYRYNITSEVYALYPGSGNYDFYYVDSEGIKGFDYNNKEVTLIRSHENKIENSGVCGCVGGDIDLLSYCACDTSSRTVSVYNKSSKKTDTVKLSENSINDILDILIDKDENIFLTGFNSNNEFIVEKSNKRSEKLFSTVIDCDIEPENAALSVNADGVISLTINNDNELKSYTISDNGYKEQKSINGAVTGVFANKNDVYALMAEKTDTKICSLSSGISNSLKDINIPQGYSVFDGNSEYDFFYSNVEGIYGYNISSGRNDCILNMLDCNLNLDIYEWFSEDDNNYICFASDAVTGDCGFYRLKRSGKTTYEVEKNKKIITIAGYNCLDQDIKNQIIRFNNKNDSYRIKATDYSKFDNIGEVVSGINSGKSMMNMEMISGNIPDIIIGGNETDFESLNRKKFFADLSPYVNQMNDNDYYTKIRDCFTDDSMIYALASEFSLNTLSAASSEFSGGQQYDDVMFGDELEKVYKDSKSDITQKDLIRYLIINRLSSFVDCKNNTCDFSNEKFIKLLELIKKYGRSDDTNLIQTEDYRIKSSFDTIISLDQAVYTKYFKFESQGKLMGCPVSGYDEWQYSFTPEKIFAVSDKCEYKDVAWKFIDGFFTEDTQSNSTFLPVSRKSMNGLFENSQYKEDNKYMFYYLPQMPDEYADKIKNIFEDLNIRTQYNYEIEKIITDEIILMNSGSLSESQAADNIQDKVNIYLKEIS